MSVSDQQYFIYFRKGEQRIPVSKEVFENHYKDINVFRRRHQRHNECFCPKDQRLYCDTDCDGCPYRIAPANTSLDEYITDNDGCKKPLIELQEDETYAPESILEKREKKQETQRILSRIAELMPEAIEIGQLRLQRLSDREIAARIGVSRKTTEYRLKKLKETIVKEFSENS